MNISECQYNKDIWIYKSGVHQNITNATIEYMFENIHGTVAHILVLPLPTHNVVALGTNSTQELTSISQPDHHHHHHHHHENEFNDNHDDSVHKCQCFKLTLM